MIPITEALKIIKQHTPVLSSEDVEIKAVCGRVLAEDIFADMDLPPFDRSQMDGYAVKFEDTADAPVKLKIVGEAAAGKGWHQELKHGQAVRIMTGAPVPQGANAVQKQELTNEAGGFVEILETVKEEKNIVRRASEIKQNEKVFSQGQTVNSAMIASLAAFGYSKIKVGRQPRVSVLATGSEIVPLDSKPETDQIRDSNSIVLCVYAEKSGAIVKTFPLVGDDVEKLRAVFQTAISESDILLISGGVSVGKYDFTKSVLRELGAEIFFEKVSLRPGKPTVFGKINETLIFGLPGNPVSAIVTFCLLARTAILQMQGASETELETGFAVLDKKLKGAAERDSYLPAELFFTKHGEFIAKPLKWGGSSDFVSFARADALVLVPKDEILEEKKIVKIAFLPK
jgi:molybdenum cofactor synthesis domain-containing protein